MKPAWDRLMKKYDGHTTAVVADVDCTADGQELCRLVGVDGYPTIKYGDPAALKDYEGGRDFKSLELFVKENLVPACTPGHLELCDADQQKQINEFEAMSPEDLDRYISEKEAEIKGIQTKFEEDLKEFDEAEQQFEAEMRETQAKVRTSGLTLMKQVKASRTEM